MVCTQCCRTCALPPGKGLLYLSDLSHPLLPCSQLFDCIDAIYGTVEAASNAAHVLLTYEEFSDYYWSNADCNLDYGSLPDENRSEEDTLDDCKARCEDRLWCTHFTYYPSSEKCYLFNVNSDSYDGNTRCESSKGAISGEWYGSSD